MLETPSNDIQRNLSDLRERIAKAAMAAGRQPVEVGLVAVSKTFPEEFVRQAMAAGQLCFGENRVQEAETKIPALRAELKLEWHLIGHLQSNKARRAAELFDVIHSVDSVKLALRLNEACRALGKVLPVLVQVDIGEEETKFGADQGEVRQIVAAASNLPGIRLNGLMTIPPFFDDPELTRPYFARLREIRDQLESESPGCLGNRHLSMGMTNDFEVAIQEGATLVRIGTAIFGARPHA